MSLRHGQMAREYSLTEITDPHVRRKMMWTAIIGRALLTEEKFERCAMIDNKNTHIFHTVSFYCRLITISSDMEEIYSVAVVPKYNEPSVNFSLEPDITNAMANSRKSSIPVICVTRANLNKNNRTTVVKA